MKILQEIEQRDEIYNSKMKAIWKHVAPIKKAILRISNLEEEVVTWVDISREPSEDESTEYCITYTVEVEEDFDIVPTFFTFISPEVLEKNDEHFTYEYLAERMIASRATDAIEVDHDFAGVDEDKVLH
jgi:hypothetical protein